MEKVYTLIGKRKYGYMHEVVIIAKSKKEMNYKAENVFRLTKYKIRKIETLQEHNKKKELERLNKFKW